MKITIELFNKLNEGVDITSEEFEDIKSILLSVDNIMKRYGYGIGECGYYFNENIKDLVSYKEYNEDNAKRIMRIAEDFSYMLNDLGLIG